MEKFVKQICEDISEQIAKTIEEIMPMGHIGVCFLSKDRLLAQKSMRCVNEFEYKITYIEYPDGSICDEDTVKDITNSPDDIRLFIGVGGREIASILGNACALKSTQYALIAASPFIYGVGYAIDAKQAPIKLLLDKDGLDCSDDYARCIGVVFAHRIALWEKKYVSYMLGTNDYCRLKQEQDLLDGIIGDGEMSDKEKLFEGIWRYSDVYGGDFISSVDITAKLIEHFALTNDRGESMLIAATALLKYFKAIMSVEEYRLLIPSDVTTRCREIAKLSGIDISEIIYAIKNREFQSKWLYIHAEYREDMLKELEMLEAKLVKIIKSAKRFMSDVGYHMSEEYDSNIIIKILYNLSPLTHECSPIAMAEYLGITKD